jgi:hypothetical protein
MPPAKIAETIGIDKVKKRGLAVVFPGMTPDKCSKRQTNPAWVACHNKMR